MPFDSLYEECLLRYNNNNNNHERSRKNNHAQNDATHHHHHHQAAGDAMEARASLAGVLQAAWMDSNKEDDEGTRVLWNHTLLEMDQNYHKSSNMMPLDWGNMGKLLESLEADFAANDDKDDDDDNFQDENLIETFFALHPECVRNPNDVVVEIDDCSSDDEEEDADLPKHPTANRGVARPPTASNPYQRNHQPPTNPHHFNQPPRRPLVVRENQPRPSSLRAAASHPNPYHHHQQPATSMAQRTASSHNQNVKSTAASAASWDALQTQNNPFQTAFEYSTSEEFEKKNHSNPDRSKQGPSQTSDRPSSIPNSLKRKFQPPKRGAATKQKKEAGGTIARQSSPSKSNDDENELPEALKGLDKELVDKIQNEIIESGETITFDHIAGLDDAKQTVQELVCWPMKRPDLFTGLRKGPNGLLLFGPPGTGKTLIGKAIAHESGATFFSISSSSLTSKWIGEGEKLVRTLFAVAAYREPAVVFIDEIDSLLTQRKADENEASRRIKTEFLVQLDGTGTGGQGRVLVIGATNRPHELDDAARRRFVKRLYIPLPATPDREILLRKLLETNKHCLEDKDFTKLSHDTAGFSGADLKALCVEAAMGPLRGLGAKALQVDARDVPAISAKHFRQALRGMHPSVAQADLEVYLEWNKTYGTTRSSLMDEDDGSDDE